MSWSTCKAQSNEMDSISSLLFYGGLDSVYVSVDAIRIATIKMIERNTLEQLNKQYLNVIAEYEKETQILKDEYIIKSMDVQKYQQLYMSEKNKTNKLKWQRNVTSVVAVIAIIALTVI